jgi:hypothetical protein
MREAWSRLLCLLLALLLASCAASSPYASDYPLTMESFTSRDGVMSGRVPQGWFSETDDTLGAAMVAWFVRDDLSASLALKEIALDRRAAERVSKEGLSLLAKLSAAFRPMPPSAEMPEPVEFQLAGRPYCAYETGAGVEKRRTVVFEAKGKYYECETRPVKGRWEERDLRNIFSVQQSFLASLRY